MQAKNIWPKEPPKLSAEQRVAREQFVQKWLELLPKRYAAFERFNQGWVAKLPHAVGSKTLEIGAGLGEHIAYENLKDQEYYCLDLRQPFCELLALKMPKRLVICGDIQTGLPLEDHFFDRILTIHVLEHLPNLPSALLEVKRLLKPNGVFDVVIPCEGGWAYTLGRKLSAERFFEKTFKMSYEPIIKSEHINNYREIMELLREHFHIEKAKYYPLAVPICTLNLAVGLRLRIK